MSIAAAARTSAFGLLIALCGACGASGVPAAFADDGDRMDTRDPREVERNREAMLELMSHGNGGLVESAPPVVAAALPSDLRVDVLGADGAVVVPGEGEDAERSALDAVLEAGPAALFAAVDIEPVQGSTTGFRILAISGEASALTRAGIRPGDVIRRVNGHEVLMPDAFMEAWASLSESDAISIDIERDGERTTLSIPVHAEVP